MDCETCDLNSTIPADGTPAHEHITICPECARNVRPGPKFAADDEIEALGDMPYDLVRELFRLDAAFLSNGSTLYDFLDYEERDQFLGRAPKANGIYDIESAYRRIQIHYGIDVRPHIHIWKIAQLIQESHR